MPSDALTYNFNFDSTDYRHIDTIYVLKIKYTFAYPACKYDIIYFA